MPDRNETVPEEADRLTRHDRQSAYGHPLDDFSKTAGVLNALFRHKLKEGEEFSPEDIPIVQIAVKLSRQVHYRKRDNWVDICGYASTGQMVHDERERREADKEKP